MVKLTIKECKDLAILKGGICLSDEYTGNKSNLNWLCSEDHEWEASFSSIKNNNSWCPYCAGRVKLNIEECLELAVENGGLCLSTNYINARAPMKWQCSDGHIFYNQLDHVKNGNQWCPHCSGRAQNTIEQCQELAVEKGGDCLSEEYINNHIKLKWQCEKLHEWEAIFNSIQQGKWCPTCSGSRSEALCREIIEAEMFYKFPKKRPSFLEGLELDGYCEELNMAFEYNGPQHYKYFPHYHRNGIDDFKNQQIRDRKKYKICNERGIKLILIPDQFTFRQPEKLKNYIIDALICIS